MDDTKVEIDARLLSNALAIAVITLKNLEHIQIHQKQLIHYECASRF